MRHYAGRDFELVVGDAGSTDGSLPMLRGFEARGWLELEVAAGGRKHAEWLDLWLGRCADPLRGLQRLGRRVPRSRLARRPRRHGASDRRRARVRADAVRRPDTFVHPVTGAARRLAPRPTPWLLLLDTEQVRGRVDASFGYHDVVDPDAFGGKVAYDVGAAYFAALDAAGLTWAEMPPAWQPKFRHFGGLTWLKSGKAGATPRVRAAPAGQARPRPRCTSGGPALASWGDAPPG